MPESTIPASGNPRAGSSGSSRSNYGSSFNFGSLGPRDQSPSQPFTIIYDHGDIAAKNPACKPIYDNQFAIDGLNFILANLDYLKSQGVRIDSAFISAVTKELQHQIAIARYIGEDCRKSRAEIAIGGNGTSSQIAIGGRGTTAPSIAIGGTGTGSQIAIGGSN